MKRGNAIEEDCPPGKRAKPATNPFAANSSDGQMSWSTVQLGDESLKTGHRFTIEYITTATVPCFKFTSIAGFEAAGSPCRVHVGAWGGRFVGVLHMPARGVLDVLNLVLTGDRVSVKDRGYQSVLPEPGTRVDDGSIYSVVSIGKLLRGMMVPGNNPGLHCISGMWSAYKQNRGPLFIACDPWTTWDDDEPASEAQQPEDPDSGIEDQCATGEESDMEVHDSADDKDPGYCDRGCDSDSDTDEDVDYDDEFVFPLCHSYQLPVLLRTIKMWLDTGACMTRGLLVDCKVPARVTLVPIPKLEDDYKYTGYNSRMHWPELTSDEVTNMTTTVYVA